MHRLRVERPAMFILDGPVAWVLQITEVLAARYVKLLMGC